MKISYSTKKNSRYQAICGITLHPALHYATELRAVTCKRCQISIEKKKLGLIFFDHVVNKRKIVHFKEGMK